MSEVYCYRTIRGTGYDKAVKKYFEQLPRWKKVFDAVSELLGEKITRMAFYPHELHVDPKEIKNPENKKLFTKDGCLKANLKKAKEIRKQYQQIVKDAGLEEFKELKRINFAFGIIRTSHSQTLESFRTHKNELYFKANFDLGQRTDGILEPISEVEYQQTYLEELKKQQEDDTHE